MEGGEVREEEEAVRGEAVREEAVRGEAVREEMVAEEGKRGATDEDKDVGWVKGQGR